MGAHSNMALLLSRSLIVSLKRHATLNGSVHCCIETSGADGLWTSHLHACIGWKDDASCPFCGEADEDLRHVLYACDAWRAFRVQLTRHREWLHAQPPAVELCLHCPSDAPNLVVAVWPQLQLEACKIIQARDAGLDARGLRQTKCRAGDERAGSDAGKQTDEAKWAKPTQQHWQSCRPLDFNGNYPDAARQPKWMYTRSQWHRLSRYFTRVQRYIHQEAPKGCVAPGRVSCLEVYLSYLIENDMQRFETQIGSAANGDWLTTQVERFRAAITIWTKLAECCEIFPDRQTGGERMGWGGRFGIGQFQIVSTPILIPHLDAVHAWIETFPTLIQQTSTSDADQHAWRRIRVERENSQEILTRRSSSEWDHALPASRRRLRGKQEITRWMECANTADAWRQRIHAEMLLRHGRTDTLETLRALGIS